MVVRSRSASFVRRNERCGTGFGVGAQHAKKGDSQHQHCGNVPYRGGVEAVIDTGKAKKASYDQTRKVDVLLSSPISQSSAEQRAGRAGRTAPGYCLRMWTLAT